MSYTKGEWKSYNYENDVGVGINGTTKNICSANNIEDANLISASPDLLEACIRVLVYLENNNNFKEVIPCYNINEYVELLKQAINKARGL